MRFALVALAIVVLAFVSVASYRLFEEPARRGLNWLSTVIAAALRCAQRSLRRMVGHADGISRLRAVRDRGASVSSVAHARDGVITSCVVLRF